jgi:hypothetical protein
MAKNIRYQYDATQDQWLHGDPGVLPGSVAAADQRFVNATPKTSDGGSPRLSLVEWLMIGPMAFGLGFMMGVYWP